MITIFTCPKAFRGHINTIQRNAILSWLRLEPRPEILILGNEEGTASFCKEFDIKHIPEIKCNELGIPLISSIFSQAAQNAENDILCYANTDIIFMSDIIDTLKLVFSNDIGDEFLLIGKRWDIDIVELISFNDSWEVNLHNTTLSEGKLHSASGKDYFVFPKHFFKEIPHFAIGRIAWDDWLVYTALKKKAFVIDITNSNTVAHQNHDYSHINDEEKSNRDGLLALRNRKLAGSSFHSLHGRNIDDASHVLIGDEIISRSRLYLFYRNVYWFVSKYYMPIKRFYRYHL